LFSGKLFWRCGGLWWWRGAAGRGGSTRTWYERDSTPTIATTRSSTRGEERNLYFYPPFLFDNGEVRGKSSRRWKEEVSGRSSCWLLWQQVRGHSTTTTGEG